MLRIATALTRCLYHKVIRIDLKKNKMASVQDEEQIRGRRLPLSEELKKRERESQQQVSLRTLKKTMDKQGSSSKQEQQINRMIKAEIKVSALLKLHKERYFAFTPTNLINLLIKALALRQINTRQQEPEKIMGLLNFVSRKANKFSPENMVRFLHSIKKANVLLVDFQLLSPFIKLILDQFSARTNETNPQAVQGQIESFYVISLQTNIKFLHALHHLHFMTGSEFQPAISTLIRASLSYFHQLLSKGAKDQKLHNVRDINWHFYVSFVRLASQYDMPVEVVATFMRAINMLKKAYHGTYHYLFAIEEIAHTLPSLRANCRGENITRYQHVYHIHLFIYQLIEKPNELIHMRPLHLLNHCKHLAEFTQEEIAALDFKRLRNNTLERVLRFTLRVYSKFFTNNYTNDTEKTNITKWIQQGQQGSNEFLTDFILLYRKISADKIIKNEEELTQLHKLCLQHFKVLTPYSQMVLLKLALQEQPQSCKPLLDIFFGKGQKISESLKYKKNIQVTAYSQLISLWGKMSELGSISVDPLSEGCFVKLFFSRIATASNIDWRTTHFAARIIKDRPFFSLIIKKYIRVSQGNRNLGKTFVDMTESSDFKRELQACRKELLDHEWEDKARLNDFWPLKKMIRRNMRRALSNYHFILSLLSALQRLSGGSDRDYSKSVLFTELLFNFNEEVKCLHFKELFTKEIYLLVRDIADELERKAVLDPSLEIYKITQYEQYDIARSDGK